MSNPSPLSRTLRNFRILLRKPVVRCCTHGTLLLVTMDITQNSYPKYIAGVYCNISESQMFGLGSSTSPFVIKGHIFSLRIPPTYRFVVVVILKNHILKLCTKACCTSPGNSCLSFPFLSSDFPFPLEDSQFIHRCP